MILCNRETSGYGWYTAPTAIRMLMRSGESVPKNYDLESLRYLCSVGEPLNPEAIHWAISVFGLPLHDNWWQTETGGILIANYPSMSIKPGSMGKPFPGIKANIVDDDGNELPRGKKGNLAIKPPWPSMMKAVWGDPKKYKSYFKGGWYISGDVALIDEDGYFWFIGRADDIIKTAGERVGPFEVESALVEHPAIVEAGVLGKPDPVRGEIIKAFVSLKKTTNLLQNSRMITNNLSRNDLQGMHIHERSNSEIVYQKRGAVRSCTVFSKHMIWDFR